MFSPIRNKHHRLVRLQHPTDIHNHLNCSILSVDFYNGNSTSLANPLLTIVQLTNTFKQQIGAAANIPPRALRFFIASPADINNPPS
jgi:hypothetical protein